MSWGGWAPGLPCMHPTYGRAWRSSSSRGARRSGSTGGSTRPGCCRRRHRPACTDSGPACKPARRAHGGPGPGSPRRPPGSAAVHTRRAGRRETGEAHGGTGRLGEGSPVMAPGQGFPLTYSEQESGAEGSSGSSHSASGLLIFCMFPNSTALKGTPEGHKSASQRDPRPPARHHRDHQTPSTGTRKTPDSQHRHQRPQTPRLPAQAPGRPETPGSQHRPQRDPHRLPEPQNPAETRGTFPDPQTPGTGTEGHPGPQTRNTGLKETLVDSQNPKTQQRPEGPS